MDLDSLLRNGQVPQIGIGPGIFGYSDKLPKKRTQISRLANGVLNRLYRNKKRKNGYIEAVANSFRIGYRLLDYSAAYGDGSLIGEAIVRSGVPREDLIITSRVGNRAQMNHDIRTEFFRTLNGLGVEYVDILQFHWPVTDCYLDTWREMERLYEEGYVKHLGVANCHQHHLEEIFKICKYRPEVGQFEIHPLFTQKQLIQYYKENGIVVEAYTPIARYDDRLVRLPLLKKLEAKYNKNFVQIILRWHVQNGVIPLVRSLNPQHQALNLNIFDFCLDDDDMRAIDAININSRLRYDPDNCDFTIL
jgi:diketogulonate reductase-like aldo/keto reductase